MKKVNILLCLFFFGFLPVANAQIISTIAGTGSWGFSGDGGPASAAKLHLPWGLALDTAGNLLVADLFNNRIRKIDATGIIRTIAGNGSGGFGGDGGPATAAQVDSPIYIATDAIGNIYFTTTGNVRKIDPTGIITSFAGVPGTGSYSGDGGQATAAHFNKPRGIIADNAGNVYICDHNNYRVRRVDVTGIVTTVAGNGTMGNSGDGGMATDAQIEPEAITIDGTGNLVISDFYNRTIRKVNISGIITNVTGLGVFGFSGDGGPATAAEIADPAQLAFDSSGNLFFCDVANLRIRKIDTSGTINTIAGNGTVGSGGDMGPALVCQFFQVVGIAIRQYCGETIYLADEAAQRIRKIVYYNNPPLFVLGHTHNLTVCDGVSVSLDTLLAIADGDVGQHETWSVLLPPAHGALTAAYSATSTGGSLIPSGLSYVATSGYTGNDTFKVVEIDCGNVPDSIAFYVSVTHCALGTSPSPSERVSLYMWPNPNGGAFVFSLGSVVNEPISVVITNMVGERVQEFCGYTNKEVEVKLDVPPGMYFISAVTKSGVWSGKVVVR